MPDSPWAVRHCIIYGEYPLSLATLDSSPKGEQALARSAALSQKAALQMPFSVTTPPVKMGFRKVRRLS